MKILTTTLARVFYALPIAIFGIFHFMDGQAMSMMVPSWLPFKLFWVYFLGLTLIAAAVSIMINKKAKLASLLLAALLLIFVLTIWLPQTGSSNEQQAMMAMSSMLRDFGLMGGALMFAGIAKD